MCQTKDQIAILQWDEASVSTSEAKAAMAAMAADPEGDRTTIFEYLDDVGEAVRLLAKADRAHRCYALDMLSGYLNEAHPALLQLASMLSSGNARTVRLVLTRRKGRPRNGGVHPDKTRQIASAALTYVAVNLRTLGTQPLASATVARIRRILVSLGALFRDAGEDEPRLIFKRPKSPPRDRSQKTVAKKMTIDIALQARGILPIETVMWDLITQYENGSMFHRYFLPKNESEFKTLRKSMRAEGTWPSAQ